jgi:hypothetical protein
MRLRAKPSVKTIVGLVYRVRDWYQYWYEHWYQIPDQSGMNLSLDDPQQS